MENQARANEHNVEIDIYKLLFAFSIFLFHSHKFLNGVAIFGKGYIGTEFFFMVSGYLMAHSLKNGGGGTAGEFFGGKVKSIYVYYLPAFLVAFISRQIILRPDFVNLGKNVLGGIFELTATHMSGLMMRYGYNGPDWYISSMLLAMIVIYPFLKRFRSYTVPWGGLLVAVACYGILHYNAASLNVTSEWFHFTYLGNFRALGSLSLGISIYGFVENIKAEKYQFLYTKVALTVFSIIKCLCLIVLFCIFHLYAQFKVDIKAEICAVMIVALVVFLTFGRLSWGSRLCSYIPNRIGKAVSTFSTVLFFSHRVIVFQLMEIDGGNRWKFFLYIVGTLVSMAVTYGASVLIKKLMKQLHSFRISKSASE